MTVGPQVVSMVGPLATNCVGIGGSKLLPMYIYIYIYTYHGPFLKGGKARNKTKSKQSHQFEILKVGPSSKKNHSFHMFSAIGWLSVLQNHPEDNTWLAFQWPDIFCIQPSDHAFSYQWSQCSWTYFNQVLGSSKMKRNLEYYHLEETTTGTWSCYPLVIQDVWQRPSPIFPQCRIWCAFGCSMAKNVDSTPEKPANQRFPCRRSPPNPSKHSLPKRQSWWTRRWVANDIVLPGNNFEGRFNSSKPTLFDVFSTLQGRKKGSRKVSSQPNPSPYV